MKKHIIYKAECKITGKMYIGRTSKSLKERIASHKTAIKNSKSQFHGHMKKYGFDNIKWSVLYDGIPDKLKNKVERWAIFNYDTYVNGLNGKVGDYITLEQHSEDLIRLEFDIEFQKHFYLEGLWKEEYIEFERLKEVYIDFCNSYSIPIQKEYTMLCAISKAVQFDIAYVGEVEGFDGQMIVTIPPYYMDDNGVVEIREVMEEVWDVVGY